MSLIHLIDIHEVVILFASLEIIYPHFCEYVNTMYFGILSQ